MPSNSQFTINNFSPDFRDALLNRNLLADTVTNNSLSSWLDGINKIPDIGDGVGIIKGSGDIETEGVIYRKTNIKFSKINLNEYYTGIGITYPSVDVDFPNSLYSQYSTSPASSPTNDSIYWRDENTIFNIFKGGNPEYYGNSVISYKDTDIVTNTSYINNSLFSAKNNPETAAFFRRDLSVTQNQYKADIYEKVSLDLLPFETNPALAILNLNPNTYAPSLEAYTSTLVPANGPFQGGDIRQFNTGKNMYLDVDKQTTVDLNTTPVANIQYKSYLDENGNLNYGDTGSVQLSNALASISEFAGGSFGAIPDFDVRNSIVGRALTSGGVLSDTRLGQISPQFLGDAIRNNIGFNLREETLGRVNTNLLSLAMGGSLIVPNNKITVASTTLGKGLGFLEKITGAKIPVSLLQRDADIFSYNTKGYIEIGNIERANNILKNTGKGTVGYLFGNIKSNINPSFLGNRQGYAPAFNGGGNDKISDSDAKLYFLGDKGMVKNILSQSEENSPVVQSSYNLEGMVRDSGFNQGPTTIYNHHVETIDNTPPLFSKFTWSDKLYNKLPRTSDTALNGTDFTEPKTILFKTQELFNSGKMRTLVSGKGVKANIPVGELDEITSTYEIGGQRYMSKGSAVFKNGGKDLGSTGSTVDNMFARAWSTVDGYNTYDDLQKHSALSPKGRVDKNLNIEESVLREAGVVQIGPYSDDNDIKRFMFSLENLAWSDSTTKLLPCEIGPGDPLTNRKGRIMWFPPYDIAINESVSASYDRTNFIGRGEPIYTYNNTERTGTLSWKIVVDHPNYLNFFRDKTDAEYASFFAGAMEIEEIKNRVLSEEEKEKLEMSKATKRKEEPAPKPEICFDFNVHFPNDVAEVPTNDKTMAPYGYENGIDYDTDLPIDYGENATGKGSGVEFTTRSFGSSTEEDNDNTNFGFNGTQSKFELQSNDGTTGLELNGWYEFNEVVPGALYFTEGNCKYCKITMTGYASPHGSPSYNNKLAKARGDELKTHFVNTYEIDPGRIKVNKAIPIKEGDSGCKKKSAKDLKDCKENRKVLIEVKYDATLEKKDTPIIPPDPIEPIPKFTIPLSRFYTECNYFEKIEETDNFVYAQFKDKIKNFHPAFHAITPEGFNSRLTFLQQCMRQGPTNGSNNPDNLAFGKPPVCILRLGDFYHTKIIIESLTIDYEPIVWDLNPEGVGVQPMIANINISFAFIGGSSMKGPINRLQNAISFNYFANTELYDPRAERIKSGAKGQKGTIIEGNFPYSEETRKRLAKLKKDQEAAAAAENKRLAEEEKERIRLKGIANDKEILNNIIIDSYKVTEILDSFALIIGINKSDKITDTGLQGEYSGKLFIKNSKTNENVIIGFITAKPDEISIDNTSFLMDTVSFTTGKEKDEATFKIGDNPLTLGFLEFSILNNLEGDENFFDDPKIKGSTKINNLLNPCGETITVIYNDIEQEVFEPCKNGPHMLILEWTDEKGFNASSRKVYNKANNEFSNN